MIAGVRYSDEPGDATQTNEDKRTHADTVPVPYPRWSTGPCPHTLPKFIRHANAEHLCQCARNPDHWPRLATSQPVGQALSRIKHQAPAQELPRRSCRRDLIIKKMHANMKLEWRWGKSGSDWESRSVLA